ncbi:MAG: transporter [Alloprevotella sp.]|nr:transporter [Alloprevotella sp.]
MAIISGIAGYFIMAALPLPAPVRSSLGQMPAYLQPALIFAMLFITFCKVELKGLRIKAWHLWLLLIQCGLFTAIGLLLVAMPASGLRVVLEGAMLCLICPTATAGAVVTRKLGGNVGHITAYTIMINIAVAMLIPAMVPFVHPQPSVSILSASLLILGKVFPLLIMPLASAMALRWLWPSLARKIASRQELSFYLWAVALTLALAVTARSIAHSQVELSTQLWLVAVSIICCAFQFWAGRKIGAHYGDKVTAGQSLGQKNTVLVIWMGFTFFTPVTSIVGGFYSIWHNVLNSIQLHRHHMEEQRSSMAAESLAVTEASTR